MPILDKLSAIQAELKAPKSQYNSFGKYNYRKCEDILEAVKPLLAKYGCTLVLKDEIELIGDRYYVKTIALLKDTESAGEVSVSAYAREEEKKAGMDAAQITGAASSYARKYALNGLFCIDDTADADVTNDGTSPIPSLTLEQYTATVNSYAMGKKAKDGGDLREALIANCKPTKAQLKIFDADVDKVRSEQL